MNVTVIDGDIVRALKRLQRKLLAEGFESQRRLRLIPKRSEKRRVKEAIARKRWKKRECRKVRYEL